MFGTPTEFVNGDVDPLASPSRKRGGGSMLLWFGVVVVMSALFVGLIWFGFTRNEPQTASAPSEELPTLPPPKIKTGVPSPTPNIGATITQAVLDIRASGNTAVATFTETRETQVTRATTQGTPTPTRTLGAAQASGGVTQIYLVVTNTPTPRVVTATHTATDKVVLVTNAPGPTQTPWIIVQTPTTGPTQTPWFFITQPPVITVVMYQTVIFYATQEVTRIITATPSATSSTPTLTNTSVPTATLTPTPTRTP